MKPWYHSKIIWGAVLTAIIGLGTSIAGSEVVTTQVASGILVAVGILNVILRSLSDGKTIGK